MADINIGYEDIVNTQVGAHSLYICDGFLYWRGGGKSGDISWSTYPGWMHQNLRHCKDGDWCSDVLW